MARDPVVFVVDDDPAAREPLQWLLESLGLEVRAYASGQEFLDAFEPEASGCVLLDVRMLGMSGLELQIELNRRGVRLPTIFLTGHADVPMAVRAMKNGAFDFIEKPYNDQVLLDCVQRAIADDQAKRERHESLAEDRERLASLSPREREILDLLVEGLANKQVADRLGLSTRTVEGHRSRLMYRLGVESLAELVRLKLRVDPESS